MAPLLYPWIIAFLFVIVIIALLNKRYILSAIIFFLLVILNWACECFALNICSESKDGKNGIIIKVMTWNINGDEYNAQKISSIATIINEQKPDILFLAEYYDGISRSLDSIIRKELVYSTYPYYTGGHVFYSRYPYDDVRIIAISDYENPLRVHCSFNVNGSPLDIYGCHYASNNYTYKQQLYHINDISSFDEAKEYLNNIIEASIIRTHETDAILADIDSHQCDNVIVMGDFNEVSGSIPLSKYKRNGFHDAWWEGGCGYGATIHNPIPYRIDHILFYNNKVKSIRLKLRSINKINTDEVSDHDCLVAEFEIR